MKRLIFSIVFLCAALALSTSAFASANKVLNLPCPKASATAGAMVWIGALNSVSADVKGTFSATMQIQSSIDGTTWTVEGSNVTSAAHRTFTAGSLWAKCYTVTYSTGTATATASGVPTYNRKSITMAGVPSDTTGASTAMYVGDLDNIIMEISNNGNSTTQAQTSVDGTVWTNLGSAYVGTGGRLAVTAGTNYVRLNVTAWALPDAGVDGVVHAKVSGQLRPASP